VLSLLWGFAIKNKFKTLKSEILLLWVPFTVNSHILMLIRMTAWYFLLGTTNTKIHSKCYMFIVKVFQRLVSISVKTGFKLTIIRYALFISFTVSSIITCGNMQNVELENTDLGQKDSACFMVVSRGTHNTCLLILFLFFLIIFI
jgi:hypothetical protein